MQLLCVNNGVFLGPLKSESLKFYFKLFSLSVISLFFFFKEKKGIKNNEIVLKGAHSKILARKAGPFHRGSYE